MASPLANPRITQPWGRPNQRYASKRHTGIDYGCAVGTPVLAVANGTISKVMLDKSYGNVVVLKSDVYEVWYCHLSQPKVVVGQTVTVGQELGLSGNTGNSTGPHLHLETRIAPFRYGNDVSCPFIEDPAAIDPNAPADRKVPLIAASTTSAPKVAAKAPAGEVTKVLIISELMQGQADDISLVQSALHDHVDPAVKVTGKWDAASKAGYAKWQTSLGFKGKDADGNPGPTSLKKLGEKYGFKVV